MKRSSSNRWLRTAIRGICSTTLFAAAAAFASPGAIWTSLGDGATVNGNLYLQKSDVYLNGGPQNNSGGSGIPDGPYYFQVTDPSGAVLLSSDSVLCRQVTVSGGRIFGASGSCPHANGTLNSGNTSLPVQLIPFADTPNNGGEYKVWLTSVDNYNACILAGSLATQPPFGFCNSDNKTDNFKVQTTPAQIVACKFNDSNGNGVQDQGETTLSGWPITATGVDGGTVAAQTDVNGCVTFSVSTFPATVTVTEGTLGVNWHQTAPADGSVARNGTTPAYTVTGGVVSTTNLQGGDILDIDFGNNNPDCALGCSGQRDMLLVTKTAFPTYKVTWGIQKAVDKTEIDTSSTSPSANYTVTVTHDVGTGFVANGQITVSNASIADIGGVIVSDTVDNGGTCAVTNGDNGGNGWTVPAGQQIKLDYTCTYADGQVPAAGLNTAQADWGSVNSPQQGFATVDFGAAVVVDGTINVSDTLHGSLGSVSYTDASPKTFTYSQALTGVAGTCTTTNNTASFTSTTSNSTATGDASASVKVCVGAAPTVSKTANPAFKRTYAWTISKAVDKTKVEQVGGTATFNYTVIATETGFTDSDWTMKGTITVANPNDWEDITVSLSDAIDNGGACTIDGGNTSLLVAKSSSATANYTCTYASQPSAATGNNTATATWDPTVYFTATGTANGSASGTFSTPTSTVNKTITVTDNFNSGGATTLGTLTATDGTPYASATYTYAHTLNVATGCTTYPNTATIVETGANASQSVQVCGPLATGALTIGFWQNKNGQGIISGGADTSGVCNSGTWLRQFAPFQDLSATASCSGVATYVFNVIKAANAGGASMNAMLKAQMLATALNVYFSDPALGTNKIKATGPIGNNVIDLTNVGASHENTSAAFGGATSASIMQLLVYAAGTSNNGGSVWYAQVKVTQGLAKDTFDAINNQQVFAP